MSKKRLTDDDVKKFFSESRKSAQKVDELTRELEIQHDSSLFVQQNR